LGVTQELPPRTTLSKSRRVSKYPRGIPTNSNTQFKNEDMIGRLSAEMRGFYDDSGEDLIRLKCGATFPIRQIPFYEQHERNHPYCDGA